MFYLSAPISVKILLQIKVHQWQCYWIKNIILKLKWNKSSQCRKMPPMTINVYYYTLYKCKIKLYCCHWLKWSYFITILYGLNWLICHIMFSRNWLTIWFVNILKILENYTHHNDPKPKGTHSQCLFCPTNGSSLRVIKNK